MEDSHGYQLQEFEHFVWLNVFLPVLTVVAPRTASELGKLKIKGEYQLSWPESKYFGTQKEYTVMKKNKVVKSGLMDYS